MSLKEWGLRKIAWVMFLFAWHFAPRLSYPAAKVANKANKIRLSNQTAETAK